MQEHVMTLPGRPMSPGPQHQEFEEWCRCVRRLLGWSAGDVKDWPELYATGHTPRDAARFVVYGDTHGD